MFFRQDVSMVNRSLINATTVAGTHPPATHDIVNVVAKLLRPWPNACPEAELAVANEFSPLVVL